MSALDTFPVEAGGHHRLRVERRPEGRWQVTLESELEQGLSELRHGLLRHLDVSGARLDPDGQAVASGEALSVSIGGRAILEVGSTIEHRPLCPFESRYLADNLAPIGRSVPAPALTPITDLHTHFAGCIRAEDLVRLGERIGAVYPVALLEGLGVGADRDVALDAAPPRVRARIERTLAIPFDRQATYREMQAIYERRRPITKRPEAFLPMCARIAEDYRAMGVRYVELSLHQIVDAAILEAATTELPRIEAETGVTIRFLAAFGRHDDREWILDYLDRVRAAARSRYVAGVDVMGHETNSTHAFARELRTFAEVIQRERPAFVVRVHAGENVAHPENVRVAAEHVRGLDVQLRIGHGLYGADDRTMALLRETGAIVEFNLDSNFALNNVQTFDPSRVPLGRYLAAGVPVVLGTDGYGIYQTTAAEEARAALFSGASEADLAAIRSTEEAYVARRADLEARRPAVATFVPPSPRFGPEVIEAKRRAKRLEQGALMERFDRIGAAVVSIDAVHGILRKRRVVAFAGAWRKSYDRVSAADRMRIQAVIDGLLTAWNPAEVVLVTGGTKYGIEGLVQRSARPRGFRVVGAVVRSLSAEDLEPGSLDHACVVGDTIYDKADGLYRLVKDHDGVAIFIGGGAVVSDEIQTADNLGIPHLLMDGPEGASTEHARQQPERTFRNAEEALRKIAELRRPRGRLRYVGPNPAVDAVVVRSDSALLLIRRHDEAGAAAGAWALPGGFVGSDAPPDGPWIGGMESPREALVRELREETGLELADRIEALRFAGEREGGGRDPRDTAERWVRSTAFAVELDGRSPVIVSGGTDAQEARFWPIDGLPPLAFDHAAIVEGALRVLGSSSRGT